MSVLNLQPGEPYPDGWRESLRAAWPNGARLTAAWRMARDVETLRDLLLGLPVDRDRLMPLAIEWAQETRLVRLESPMEHFEVAV